MPIERLKDFVRKIEKTAHRFGVSISIEAHAVGNGRCLVIPSFTTNKRGLTYLAHLFLVLTLTQIGTEYGGVPYGTGIWNLPFVHERFSNLAELMSYKKEVDPQEIFNPMKTFQGPTLLPSNPRLRKIILSTLSKFVFVPSKKESDKGCKDALAESINACAKCSACVSVCPAYYITGDETITPRGKLYKARNIEQLSRDEAERMFFCLHCGRCEEVCQEGLRLLESWDLLEDILRERFDFPREKVEEFVAEIDRKDVYKIIRSW
jgi:ferredoxin